MREFEAVAPLTTTREGTTLIVTLSRPEVRNALDAELMDALRRLWQDKEALAGVRAIVVTGAGPGFCAGADVSMLAGDRAEAAATAAEELSFLPGDVVDRPVIAAVNGVCAGAGLHFVADADIVIAGEEADFLDPHVNVGQVTALEPLTLRLRMRPDVLMRMALLGRGERLDAAAAREAGLVSEVVPTPELLPRALALAAAIAESSPAAVRGSRRVLREFERALLGEHLEAGWAAIRKHWNHPDAKEGPRAFGERRPPRWREE